MGGMGFYWLRNPVRPPRKRLFFPPQDDVDRSIPAVARMGIPYAGDHIGKRAIINPMSDFRPYRDPARPPLGNAGRARLSGDYKQDANTLDQRLRHSLIKTLMGKRQTVPIQLDRYFRPPQPALAPPSPTPVQNRNNTGP